MKIGKPQLPSAFSFLLLVLWALKVFAADRNLTSQQFQTSEGKKARLIGLEVNQVVQDWHNNVPLISNKTTIVRAHLQSLTTNGVEVRGVLTGFRNGVELPDSPRKPLNPGGLLRAQVNAAELRGSPASSLNFFLPRSWCTGTINLQFESSSVECGEIAGFPNDCSTLATFGSAAVPEVTFLRVKRFEDNRSGGEPIPVAVTEDQAQELADRLRAIYPIDRLKWNAPEAAWTNSGPPALEALLPWVDYIRILNQEVFGPSRLCYGVLSGGPDGGLAYFGGKSSVGWMADSGERYGRNRHAHELGHNLGLDHTTLSSLGTNARGERFGYCGEVAGGRNPDFPFFELLNGRIYPTLGPLSAGEDNRVYGYDVHEHKIIDPFRTAELMSYCDLPDGRWVSSFTYSNLLAQVDDRFGSAGAAASALGAKAPETYLLVRGTIDAEDRVTFAPFTRWTAVNPPGVPASGPYVVRACARTGAVVSDTVFAPYKTDPDLPAAPCTLGSFVIALKDDPDVRSISIVRDNRVIASQAATPNAPQVRVIAPNGGENLVVGPVTIRWTGSDADGDLLLYLVQYSPDNGASWMTLAVDWPRQTYAADFASLPGSGQGLIRIIAGDGFNSGSDQSDATFTVANHPPRIRIAQPENQQIALGDQELLFQALAHDVEDGDLPDENIEWQSSVDGVLGTGPIFSRNATLLSEGAHVITSTARDSANATASAVIHITVSRTVPAAFADLVLSQTKAIGSESDLTITVKNEGPNVATALQVTNTLPMGAEVFAVSSPSGDCTVMNGAVVCAIDELAAGASVIINLQLELLAPGIYTNVASVAAAELDPSPANNVALRVIEFAPTMPQLRIELVGNTLNISWSATTPANTVLRSSPTLFPGDWTDVTEPATVVDGRFNVTQEITTKTRFYRLERR
jgi:uncharacterized repeat protein (TIGR01451 family)